MPAANCEISQVVGIGKMTCSGSSDKDDVRCDEAISGDDDEDDNDLYSWSSRCARYYARVQRQVGVFLQDNENCWRRRMRIISGSFF